MLSQDCFGKYASSYVAWPGGRDAWCAVAIWRSEEELDEYPRGYPQRQE
jgi:hypothetical protein